MEKHLAIFWLNTSNGRSNIRWMEIQAIDFTDARNKLLEDIRIWRFPWLTVDYKLLNMHDNEVEGSAKR